MAHLEVEPKGRSNWWLWLIIIIIIIAIAAYFFKGYQDGKMVSKTDSTKTTTDSLASRPAK